MLHVAICKDDFTEHSKRVRDHDHRTGNIVVVRTINATLITSPIGSSQWSSTIKGYDSHLIIKQAFEINYKIANRKIDAIPNSYEKFMTFSIGDLKFIDSFPFMASSLENWSKTYTTRAKISSTTSSSQNRTTRGLMVSTNWTTNPYHQKTPSTHLSHKKL